MKKAGAILLIFLLLVSIVGLSINTHYCGGKLAGISIYLPATCGCGNIEMPSDCCSNEQQILQLDEEYQPVIQAVNFSPKLLAELPGDLSNLFRVSTYSPADFLNYKPPLIERDLTVLVQSFLI